MPSRPYITIVSGMPRSGTSLMMRMLEAGGIPALTDGLRPADQHNPHGYYEDVRTRGLARDASWLEGARGKAVKIIYRLLPHLPPHFDYGVLFMDRDLEEVFDSQQEMLVSGGNSAASQDRDRMIRALGADLESVREWLTGQPNIRRLDVPYGELVAKAGEWARAIARFLDGGLDEGAMAGVVEPGLYRHRR